MRLSDLWVFTGVFLQCPDPLSTPRVSRFYFLLGLFMVFMTSHTEIWADMFFQGKSTNPNIMSLRGLAGKIFILDKMYTKKNCNSDTNIYKGYFTERETQKVFVTHPRKLLCCLHSLWLGIGPRTFASSLSGGQASVLMVVVLCHIHNLIVAFANTFHQFLIDGILLQQPLIFRWKN